MLLLMTNSKLHMRFRLTPWMALTTNTFANASTVFVRRRQRQQIK